MTDSSPSPARPVPILLLLALLCKAAWMGWIWWHGCLPSTSDSVCFKQPAYMRLHTPNFSIPSYAGQGPSVEIINSYPAVIYFYANYAVFKLFGFGHYSSIAVDLIIHVAFSGLGSWALWRVTGRQLPGILFLICSSEWLLTSGRPEEMGMLLALISLLTLPRGAWGLAASIIGLGLAGATSPGAALVGTTLLVAYDGFSRQFDRAFWRRTVLLLTLPILLSAAIYIGYAWPHVAEAWQQDHALRTSGFYTTLPAVRLFRFNPIWALTTAGTTVAAVVLAVYARLRRPAWFPNGTPAASFVVAAAVSIAIGLMLNLLAQRLAYDYRHVFALAVASLSIATSWWTTAAGRYSAASWALALGLLVSGLPLQRDIGRHTLAPLAWNEQWIDFDQAKRIVDETVPLGATVGGDGSVWALIDSGQPFLLTRTIAQDQWPEYVISGTWSHIPTVAQTGFAANKLATQYEEITPQPHLPQDGCALNLFGFKVPVATGRCDWYVRIWKRRQP